MESIFGHTPVIVKGFQGAFIGGRRHLFINFHPLHHKLNRALAILTKLAVGFDVRFDYSLDLVGPFFDLLHAGYYTASRVTEKFVRSRTANTCPLLAETILRGG